MFRHVHRRVKFRFSKDLQLGMQTPPTSRCLCCPSVKLAALLPQPMYKEMEGLVPYASSSESCLARAAAPAAVKSSCRDTDRRKHNAFDGGAWQLQLVSLDRHTSTQLIREDRCIRKRELPTTWAIRRLSTHSLWRTSIPASVH